MKVVGKAGFVLGSLVRKLSTRMASLNTNDSRLSAERSCFTFFLARWRRELLADETEGDADAVERDRRMLDYYLDQYNQVKSANESTKRLLQILAVVITAPLVETVVTTAMTTVL